MKSSYILLMVLCLISNASIAQHANSSSLYKPDVILFMLNKSTNKIEALKKRGMLTQVKEVEAIDKEINFSIIDDFSKRFTLCPVYFFYSDQYDLVKTKDWDQVIFYDKEHLVSAKKIEVKSFGNYYIAEVNYPPAPIYEEVKKSGNINITESGGPEMEYANSRDYGILLYDDSFKLIPSKMRFINISLHKRGKLLKPETMKYEFKGAERFQDVLKNKLFQ